MTGTQSTWQAQSRAHEVYVGRPTGWGTWVTFAGVILALVGLFHLMAGFTALFQDQAYVARSGDLVINVSYDTWGWTHIILGALGIVTAYLLLRGNMVGRVLAIVFCLLSAISNLLFVTAHPVWSVIAITFDVIVIYAITVHGGELKSIR